LDLVRRVTALCTRQLATERLAPVPDETRIDQLKGELEACAADRKALQSADAGEVARIAALYTARFKELSGP
jgi:hypothetical protein